jgi:hypothetical protein
MATTDVSKEPLASLGYVNSFWMFTEVLEEVLEEFTSIIRVDITKMFILFAIHLCGSFNFYALNDIRM